MLCLLSFERMAKASRRNPVVELEEICLPIIFKLTIRPGQVHHISQIHASSRRSRRQLTVKNGEPIDTLYVGVFDINNNRTFAEGVVISVDYGDSFSGGRDSYLVDENGEIEIAGLIANYEVNIFISF